jgi:hypothetical protein
MIDRAPGQTFPGKCVRTEISPLRSPGIECRVRGVDSIHAVSFRGTGHVALGSVEEEIRVCVGSHEQIRFPLCLLLWEAEG